MPNEPCTVGSVGKCCSRNVRHLARSCTCPNLHRSRHATPPRKAHNASSSSIYSIEGCFRAGPGGCAGGPRVRSPRRRRGRHSARAHRAGGDWRERKRERGERKSSVGGERPESVQLERESGEEEEEVKRSGPCPWRLSRRLARARSIHLIAHSPGRCLRAHTPPYTRTHRRRPSVHRQSFDFRRPRPRANSVDPSVCARPRAGRPALQRLVEVMC